MLPSLIGDVEAAGGDDWERALIYDTAAALLHRVGGRAFALSLLASAHATQDEPEQASVVGRQALDLTVRLTSARSVRYVRDLVRTLRPRAGVPAVRDFTAEVRKLLPAAAGPAAPR